MGRFWSVLFPYRCTGSSLPSRRTPVAAPGYVWRRRPRLCFALAHRRGRLRHILPGKEERVFEDAPRVSDHVTTGRPHEEAGATPPESELILKAQGGDTAAFDALVEKYKKRLYTLVYNMLGNHEDAADLSQEIFVRAFKSLHSFRSQANFYTWLYRIGINTTLNFLKKRREAHLSLNEWDEDLEEDPQWSELVSKENARKSVDLEELREKLNEALQKLSEDHRAVVVLHDIEGMRHQEIARVLRCSEATARSRLFYAHQQLQALLANYL